MYAKRCGCEIRAPDGLHGSQPTRRLHGLRAVSRKVLCAATWASVAAAPGRLGSLLTNGKVNLEDRLCLVGDLVSFSDTPLKTKKEKERKNIRRKNGPDGSVQVCRAWLTRGGWFGAETP